MYYKFKIFEKEKNSITLVTFSTILNYILQLGQTNPCTLRVPTLPQLDLRSRPTPPPPQTNTTITLATPKTLQ